MTTSNGYVGEVLEGLDQWSSIDTRFSTCRAAHKERLMMNEFVNWWLTALVTWVSWVLAIIVVVWLIAVAEHLVRRRRMTEGATKR